MRRAVEEQHQPADGPHPRGFDVQDVVGESEYSTRQAGERDSARGPWRAVGGYDDRDSLSAEPEELGRRFLEEATQSPSHESLEPHAPQRDLEETSAMADAGMAEND